jgi:LytS/YehU family sensor histidine kinase
LFPDGSAFIPDLPGVSAAIIIPTAEGPHYAIVIGELSGGRRLLSDDTAMLEAVAVILARRIDALRITHERCEQGLREQQISKLATEAELRALRAQINPHFLFNALTTIGYLIQTSPDRALATLMRLTGMLRGVLRPAGEFVTLNEEMQLIESYLDIERARFEDRLRVTIDVPQDLRSLRIPPLIVQPLVENAIKHGIAPRKSGGEVIVSARLEDALTDDTRPSKILRISVCDTGVGASEIEMAHGRKRGVGINNIEQRLKFYFGPDTTLVVDSRPAVGTTVEARLPVTISEASTLNSAAKRRPA